VPPALALLVTAGLFAAFLAAAGANPLAAYRLIWLGGFGTWFSWQNTLVRAAPLLLTALCVALPAQLGLMVIGAEGAFVLGGTAAAAVAIPLASISAAPLVAQLIMAVAGILAGGVLIALCGVLRHWRGVNETISSLLLAYISIAVMNQLIEGPLRDPASLNRPATPTLPANFMLGDIPGSSVHVGLIFGLVACVLAFLLIRYTTFGFAVRIAGGNIKAGLMAGLPVGRLIVIVTFLGGAAAGLAGMVEVAAVQGAASADIAAGYGYTGILVAFLARQNPLAIIPVAILLGGIDASGGLLQQRLNLPDATILVLRGLLFIVLLASEVLRGRSFFAPLRRLTTPRLAEEPRPEGA
jgi:general nucleoside transport system permease protein